MMLLYPMVARSSTDELHSRPVYQFPAKSGAIHFLRDKLDCENLGVSMIDAEPAWEGLEHDHADEDHEEVYIVVEGMATLTADGDELDLETGDAVRIAPGTSRQLRTGDDGAKIVAIGAP